MNIDTDTNINSNSNEEIKTNDARINIVEQLILPGVENDDTKFLYVLWVMGDGLGHDQIYSNKLISDSKFWQYSAYCVPESKRDLYMEKVKKCTNNTNTKATMNAYAESIKTKFGMYSGSITFTPIEEKDGNYKRDSEGNAIWTLKTNYTNDELEQEQEEKAELDISSPTQYFLTKLGASQGNFTLASIDSVTGHMLKEQLGSFNRQANVNNISFGTNFATQSADPATSNVNTLQKYGFKIADITNPPTMYSDNEITDLQGSKAMFFPFKIQPGDGITLSELGYSDFNNDIVQRNITFQNQGFNNPTITVKYSSTGITIENVRAVDKHLATFTGAPIRGKQLDKKSTITIEYDGNTHLKIIVNPTKTDPKFKYEAMIPKALWTSHPILVRQTLLFLKTSGDYSFSRATWLDKTFKDNATFIETQKASKILLSIDELAVEFTCLMSNFKFGIRTYQSDAIEILVANLKETDNSEELLADCKAKIQDLARIYDISINQTPSSSRSLSSTRSTPQEDYDGLIKKTIIPSVETKIRGLFNDKFGINIKEYIKKQLGEITKNKFTKSTKETQELFRYGIIECFIRKYIKEAKLIVEEKYKQPNSNYDFNSALQMLNENPKTVFNLRKIYEYGEKYIDHITNYDSLELNMKQDIMKINDYFFDKRYKDIYVGNAFIQYVFKFFYEIVPLNNYDSVMATSHASLMDLSLLSRVSLRGVEAKNDDAATVMTRSSMRTYLEENVDTQINEEAITHLNNNKMFENELIGEEEKGEIEQNTQDLLQDLSQDLSQGPSQNINQIVFNSQSDSSAYEPSEFSVSSQDSSSEDENPEKKQRREERKQDEEDVDYENENVLFALPETERGFTIKDLVDLNIKNYGPSNIEPKEYDRDVYIKNFYLKGLSMVTHYLFYSNVDEMKIVEQQNNIIGLITEPSKPSNQQTGGSDELYNKPSIKILCEDVINKLCSIRGVICEDKSEPQIKSLGNGAPPVTQDVTQSDWSDIDYFSASTPSSTPGYSPGSNYSGGKTRKRRNKKNNKTRKGKGNIKGKRNTRKQSKRRNTKSTKKIRKTRRNKK